MDNESFIKLHRKMLDWEWYDHTNTKILFLHLLLRANWKETKWHGIDLHPGELIRTNENLAEDLGISIQQVKASLSNLISTREITCRKVGRNRVITVKNWSQYQGNNLKTTQKPTAFQPDSNLIPTWDKEYKNNKNSKKYIPTQQEIIDYCSSSGYQDVDVEKFVDYNTAKGWNMDWKAALDLWYKNRATWQQSTDKKKKTGSFSNIIQHDYDFAELEAKLTGIVKG